MHTKSEERPPAFIQEGAIVKDSLVTDGSIIAPGARVERSVLSPGVYVGPQAVVIDSILFTDCSVEAGARVERTIVDKYVTIGHRAQVGRLEEDGGGLGISTIGKNTQIPNGTVVGRDAHVSSDITADIFPRSGVSDGKILEKSQV